MFWPYNHVSTNLNICTLLVLLDNTATILELQLHMKYDKSVLREVTPVPLEYLQFNCSKQTTTVTWERVSLFILPSLF